MTDHGPLTLDQAARIGQLIDACERNAHAGWLADGRTITGTLRSIGDEQGNFPTRNDDVRGEYLRITTDLGWEHFMPMAEATALLASGELVLDYEPPRGVVLL
jgi:hypothetical protein